MEIKNLENKKISIQKDYNILYEELIDYLISNNIQDIFFGFFSINKKNILIDMSIEVFEPLVKYIEDSVRNSEEIDKFCFLKKLYKLVNNESY